MKKIYSKKATTKSSAVNKPKETTNNLKKPGNTLGQTSVVLQKDKPSTAIVINKPKEGTNSIVKKPGKDQAQIDQPVNLQEKATVNKPKEMSKNLIKTGNDPAQLNLTPETLQQQQQKKSLQEVASMFAAKSQTQPPQTKEPTKDEDSVQKRYES